MTEPFTLPGIPSDLLTSTVVDERRFKVESELISGNNSVSVQHPLPTDGDSVYCKDIWVDESAVTNWADIDSSDEDVACIPFTNLHTRIQNSTSDNPKILRIHFNRTVAAHQVGLGCTGGGDFSNVEVVLLGSGGVQRSVVDDTSNNTKYTSRNYPFEPQLFNALELHFHTADTVCLSNITIQKSTNVSAQIQGLRADGTIGTVNVTNGNNLKCSIEEFENEVSTNENKQLNTSPYPVDEFGNYAHILGDNIFKGALITIPVEHHEIHCGDSYEMSHIDDLANGGVLDILIVVPNEGLSETHPGDSQDTKQYHFKGNVSTEAEATVEFFEDVTVSANGNALDVFCRNRNFDLTDTLDMYEGPTVTSTGTRLVVAKTGSVRSSGGNVGRSDEFILKDNTLYLLRITNNVTTTEWVSVNLDYYVHPGV